MLLDNHVSKPQLVEFVTKSPRVDAELCRDFLRWVIKRESPLQDFKLTDVGNWLIENNRNFRKEYDGSHIARSYRLHSKRNYIQARLDYLYSISLIRMAGETKSEKNLSKTKLYAPTEDALLLAWILEIKSGQTTRRKQGLEGLHKFINANMNPDASSYIFFQHLFDELKKRNVLNRYIQDLADYALGNWHVDLGWDPEELLMTHFHYVFYQRNQELVKNVLGNLPDEPRKLFLFALKLKFESNEVGDIEWEKQRLENISDYTKVTVMWECSSCGARFPATVNIFDYFQMAFTLDHPIIEGKCTKCSKMTAYWDNV